MSNLRTAIDLCLLPLRAAIDLRLPLRRARRLALGSQRVLTVDAILLVDRPDSLGALSLDLLLRGGPAAGLVDTAGFLDSRALLHLRPGLASLDGPSTALGALLSRHHPRRGRTLGPLRGLRLLPCLELRPLDALRPLGALWPRLLDALLLSLRAFRSLAAAAPACLRLALRRLLFALVPAALGLRRSRDGHGRDGCDQ